MGQPEKCSPVLHPPLSHTILIPEPHLPPASSSPKPQLQLTSKSHLSSALFREGQYATLPLHRTCFSGQAWKLLFRLCEGSGGWGAPRARLFTDFPFPYSSRHNKKCSDFLVSWKSMLKYWKNLMWSISGGNFQDNKTRWKCFGIGWWKIKIPGYQNPFFFNISHISLSFLPLYGLSLTSSTSPPQTSWSPLWAYQ